MDARRVWAASASDDPYFKRGVDNGFGDLAPVIKARTASRPRRRSNHRVGRRLRWMSPVRAPKPVSFRALGRRATACHATLFRASDKSAGAFHLCRRGAGRSPLKDTFDPAGILTRPTLSPNSDDAVALTSRRS